jgi:hypothetical protein
MALPINLLFIPQDDAYIAEWTSDLDSDDNLECDCEAHYINADDDDEDNIPALIVDTYIPHIGNLNEALFRQVIGNDMLKTIIFDHLRFPEFAPLRATSHFVKDTIENYVIDEIMAPFAEKCTFKLYKKVKKIAPYDIYDDYLTGIEGLVTLDIPINLTDDMANAWLFTIEEYNTNEPITEYFSVNFIDDNGHQNQCHVSKKVTVTRGAAPGTFNVTHGWVFKVWSLDHQHFDQDQMVCQNFFDLRAFKQEIA